MMDGQTDRGIHSIPIAFFKKHGVENMFVWGNMLEKNRLCR